MKALVISPLAVKRTMTQHISKLNVHFIDLYQKRNQMKKCVFGLLLL